MPDEFLERKVLYSGDYVFKEGDPGDRAYIVQEGCIDIIKRRPNGAEVVLGKITKGGIFGEMALIDDQPRMASARSSAVTTIVAVPRKTFVERLRKSDPFIRALLGIFVRNIRTITSQAFADDVNKR